MFPSTTARNVSPSPEKMDLLGFCVAMGLLSDRLYCIPLARAISRTMRMV